MPPESADFAPRRFSTDDLAERERLSRWREEFGRALVRCDIEPLSSDAPFRAEAILRRLPGVRFALCSSSPVVYRRTAALAAEGDGSVGLVVNLGADSVVSQGGDDILLSSGDAFPMQVAEVGVLTSTRHLGILFPREALASRVANFDRAVTREIPRSSQSLRLLVSYLATLHRDVALPAADLRHTIVNHIYDLAAITLGATREAWESAMGAVAAARLDAAIGEISRSFASPDFTLEALARRQNVTQRYLQQLFEKSGKNFTARVNELRLQRALVLLTSEHDRQRRISEIAMQVGFSDLSHFNRLFRARFGDSPSGIRAKM